MRPYLARPQFINGTNMCVPPAIFTEDLYLYGISFGAMVLSVVVLPLLASFVPVEVTPPSQTRKGSSTHHSSHLSMLRR